MNDLIVHASNGRGYDKFIDSNYKYVLIDRNWNDYGFYTLHELFLIMPDGKENVKLADVRLFNLNQHCGSRFNINNSDYIGFISNVESAERLLLFLSPKERKYLISALHIKFDCKLYSDQHALLKSVLRDITLVEFEERQSEIESIISIKENISSMIERNKEVLKLK